MSDDFAALVKARSMLLLLSATCEQTLLALEAAANALDTDLTHDLRAMIDRTRDELDVLSEKVEAAES